MKRLDLDASRAKAKKAQQDGGEKLQAVSGNLDLAYSSLVVSNRKLGGEGPRSIANIASTQSQFTIICIQSHSVSRYWQDHVIVQAV